MRRPVLSQNFPNYSPPMPPVLNTGNSNSVIQQNIDSLKITNPEIYEKYKNDPKTLVHMANSFLEVAKDPEMTALEELEAPRKYDMLKTAFTDANRVSVLDQQAKDALDFGEDYALDQRAKSLAAVSRAQKDPTTTLFDDGNKVPSAYTEPVLYNSPEENMGLGNLDKVEEPPLLADFTSPMPTGARLDPYMDIPKVKGQDNPVDDMVAGENLYQYTSTPDGHHRMPNGSIMPDSEMKPATSYNEERYNVNTPQGAGVLGGGQNPTGNVTNTDGVLETNGDVPAKGNGILKTDTTSSNDRKGSAVSANARGSAMPFGKINRNEALMRIGGAMVGGSSQGFSGAMKAATDAFGNIKDANRKSETDAYNKAEATRLAEERIAALKAKGSSKDADKDKETLNSVNTQLNAFQSGLNAIAKSKAEGGNLTGIGGIFKSFYDDFTGNPDSARRLLLSRLKVDDALLRVAETKGAISNKEMDLFLQPVPTNFKDEQIWVDWINERMVALRNVQNRLNGGQVLNQSDQSYGYRAPTTNNNNDLSEGEKKYLGL